MGLLPYVFSCRMRHRLSVWDTTISCRCIRVDLGSVFHILLNETFEGAALLRRRPNQSLRQRGRRQLDPSRRGEGAAEGTGGRWYLCRQRRLGVFRWYSRAWWRVSVRINAPAARGGLRTVATAAKCHRAPVDSHPVAGRMPTGLQGAGDEHRTPHRRCHVDNVEYHCGFQGVRGGAREAVAMVTRRRISTKERSGSRFSAASSGCRPS